MGGPPAPYTQRMVRLGDWKLNYYHGHPQPLQLFNCPGTPGRLSARSVSLCKSVLYGAFVWARRALSSQKRRSPARAVKADPDELRDRAADPACKGVVEALSARLCPRPPGAVKRPQRFPTRIHFVWGFCVGEQGA